MAEADHDNDQNPAMKVLTVVGTRPQFIKAFPVSRALRQEHEEILVHTGQHYDEMLSDVFFEELSIPEPDHHLGVGSGTHAVQTAEMMTELDSLIDGLDPDVVLVYGDTNSTLAGALVASKRDAVVAHVEAGLRSFNRDMPEELNRVLTDSISDILFAPGDRARANLAAEGIEDGVFVSGDVMYDALLDIHDRAVERSSILRRLGYDEESYILATVHRAANTDDPDRLRSIVAALADAPHPVVFPAHPRTVSALQREGWWEEATEELHVVDPVGYLDFIRLVDGAERVATDSGGVQKEAFYLDTPCVTLRDETEWVETVDCGWNLLVGADYDEIRAALRQSFDCTEKPRLYGDGSAAGSIATTLAEHP